jgi:hypothetical protein
MKVKERRGVEPGVAQSVLAPCRCHILPKLTKSALRVTAHLVRGEAVAIDVAFMAIIKYCVWGPVFEGVRCTLSSSRLSVWLMSVQTSASPKVDADVILLVYVPEAISAEKA